MPTSSPNVLFILTDQHNANAMGCAGDPVVRTPGMDRLAREGAMMRYAYANSAHCGPSRVSFLTGMYEHSHLRHLNTDEPPGHLNPLPGRLRERGVRTAFVGKGHIGVRWPREQFDHTAFGYPTDAESGDVLSCDYLRYLVDRGEIENFDLKRSFTYTDTPAQPSPMPFEHSTEVWTGNETIRFLQERDRDQPFFCFTSFVRPHNPLCVSPPHDTMYDPDEIPLPANTDDRFEGKSEKQKKAARGEMAYPHRPKTEAELKKCMAHYYALVSIIDMQIQRILEELDNQGILDDTVVIYSADHGDFVGEHGFMYKNLGLYEAVHRIPFLIRYPKAIPAETVFDGFVESVDLYPFLTELLGLDNPWTVQGRSFLSAVRGEEPWTKPAVLCEHVKEYHHMAIRTRTHRLVFDATHAENELYDLEADPGETVNIWDDPAARDVREGLLMDLLRYRTCPHLLHEQTRRTPANRIPGFEQPRWPEALRRFGEDATWAETVERLEHGGYDDQVAFQG
jgi:arylsulfatase A-like enzyme